MRERGYRGRSPFEVLVPEDEKGGFIVRTMAENASDEELANDIEGQIRANADKLYATRRPVGKAAAAPAEGEPAAPATAKEPVVKAPARSSESELDIMVEE